MRVSVCKSVDIETEVDVDLDDILNEFVDRTGDQERWRSLLSALDIVTRGIARISDETIAKFNPTVHAILNERLTAQAARFKPAFDVLEINSVRKDLTTDEALAAIGSNCKVHTLAEDPEGNGHLTTGIIDRTVFECLIKMPTCKLSVATQRLIDLKYPLRVETTERVFYAFCSEPLSSEPLSSE